MKLILGGVRGSYPVAHPDFMKYGGETTSLLIEGKGGERLLIDAGTGVRELGARLAGDGGMKRVLLLMTHYHLDHVVGLPSLGVIYDPAWSVRIAAPAHDEYVVETTMSRIMDKPFWPLQVTDLGARIQFDALAGEVSHEPLRWGALEVRWCPVHHPGGCTAYRIDEPSTGASVVIASDVEWAASSDGEKALLRALCTQPTPAKLLLMDAQYVAEEYEQFRGWGHSTWPEVLALAREAGIEQVRLIHHDPRKNDEALDAINAAVTTASPTATLARAREELVIAG
ncbi:MAG TPA: MBL fold metallo-hydrolase [Kiritimatiellia bacterium]|nr:MBL fold metallo-hydrolase [Kiritimatiellia bacterium]